MLVSESAENVEIMVTTYESDESDELIYEDALDTFDMTVSLYTKLNQSCYVNLADTVGVGDTIVITSGVIRGQYILDGAIETEHLSTDLKDSLGIA